MTRGWSTVGSAQGCWRAESPAEFQELCDAEAGPAPHVSPCAPAVTDHTFQGRTISQTLFLQAPLFPWLPFGVGAGKGLSSRLERMIAPVCTWPGPAQPTTRPGEPFLARPLGGDLRSGPRICPLSLGSRRLWNREVWDFPLGTKTRQGMPSGH